MQIFIKLPYPYNKCKVFDLNDNMTFNNVRELINERTCYSNIQYYFLNSTKIISENLNNMTIYDYNLKFPKCKIEDEVTLNLIVRSNQKIDK